jgi:peptidoglycan/xylan/chitin deacetylase (PgdA/CDA1 family)
MTFDDGPSGSTPKLLNYLDKENLKGSFCIVGGSAYFNPTTLQAEYLAGHQLIVHTYRHPPLTTLSTVDVVAELGYARKIIKDITGVTPKVFRPPYGDVDDRVRAIAAAMGMQTSIWTRNPTTGEQFDTNDWKIPGGEVTAVQSYESFHDILGNATQINTGFIVLEHDLYAQTVDMAVGYFLPLALNNTPKFNIEPVIDCLHLPASEAYVETAQDKTVAKPETTWNKGFIQNVASLPVVLTNGSGSPGSAGAPDTPGSVAGSSGGDGSSGSTGTGGQSGGGGNAAMRQGVRWLAVLGAVVIGLVVA